MLSAARRAQYGMDGPGLELRYGQVISSPKRLPVCEGYFLEVKRLDGGT